MSEEVNKEQTKAAKQEKITELSDEQLAEAQGGSVTVVSAHNLPQDHIVRQETVGALKFIK